MSVDPKTLSKFCILPWVSVQVNQDGAILPCCRTDEKYLYGQLDDSTTVREAWNSENTKKMRKAMLAGEDLPQCRDCLSCESKGAPSIRRDFNRRFAADFDRVARTKADGWFSYDEGLRHLGVRFSNVCNLRCRTCSPKNSTSWSADAKAAGIPTPPTTKLSPRPTFEEFAADLEPMIPTLKSVYFAGGEPLLADGHIRFLEMLLAAGRKDVALNYNTNFTELGLGSKSIFELWHEFDEIHVSASLDGVGRVAELVRKGCDWDSIVKNFYRLGFLPNVKFSIHCTISVLNCFHLPEAIDEWLRRKMIHTPGMLELNFVRDPEWYDVAILNERERDRLREKYATYLGKLKSRVDEPLFTDLEATLELVLANLSEPPQAEARKKFWKITSTIDRIRNEELRTLIPELDYDA